MTKKSVLDQEIKWCRANRGKSGKGKAFEDGFIAGLKQAKRLYAQMPERKNEQPLALDLPTYPHGDACPVCGGCEWVCADCLQQQACNPSHSAKSERASSCAKCGENYALTDFILGNGKHICGHCGASR